MEKEKEQKAYIYIGNLGGWNGQARLLKNVKLLPAACG